MIRPGAALAAAAALGACVTLPDLGPAPGPEPTAYPALVPLETLTVPEPMPGGAPAALTAARGSALRTRAAAIAPGDTGDLQARAAALRSRAAALAAD